MMEVGFHLLGAYVRAGNNTHIETKTTDTPPLLIGRG